MQLKPLDGILGQIQPDFEQLLQIIRVAAEQSELDFMRVVLATSVSALQVELICIEEDLGSWSQTPFRSKYANKAGAEMILRGH